ncbi:MAG: hypothetical protein FJ276_32095, partial [Planctomycetes bacterium]|nr:hypothetical protein [Planctomycetota bacterium]
ILEVNYGFKYQSHPELECRGLTKEQARDLADHCRRLGIRLIPLFNCLGHQSWGKNTHPLLKKYPQFDETPHVPESNEGIYCREWCPSHPEVDAVVFDLLDELIDAFGADAVHVGMDEVFLIGDEKCPRCNGKDVGELFAGVVNRLHEHLVKTRGVEMLMWGDRLLDAAKFPYGKWEASETGSDRAIDRIPRDIIICDWHYEPRRDYPSVQHFQERGFRVVPATWRKPEAATALIRASREGATDRMLGVLFTGWSAGGNGQYLAAALTDRPESWDGAGDRQRQAAGEIAATVRAGMKEWFKDSPADLARVDSIRWNASGKGGAVAAGGSRSVAAGIQMLLQDGNAADAAAATLLALAVTDYGSFAIGGEVPLMIYDARKQEVKVLCGVGRSPLGQEAIDWLVANGIPSKGSMKASPVPGAIDLCITLLALYGTKSFEEAVAPTLALLKAGKREWHADLAVTLEKLVETERTTSGSRDEKLTAARDRFYRGDIADELEAWYIATGALLRKRDLAAHRTVVEDPVSVDYRGYTIHKCGPWTQGPALCQSLQLLERFELRQMGHLSADYIHLVTEALKLGLADRDEYYGDPQFVDVPLENLLSDRYADLRVALLDPTKASHEQRPGDPFAMAALKQVAPADSDPSGVPVRDTTTCVVADRWGNVVAATPSCNLLGNEPGPSGVTQGNRVRSLNTAPNHPNRLQPGKRPRVTLTPTLVMKDGRPVVAISVAGGDLQEQTTLNVLLNFLDFDMPPEKAVRAPRFGTSHHQDSFDPRPDRAAAIVAAGSLQVDETLAAEVAAELAGRGHAVKSTSSPIAHPVMIVIDQASGTLRVAGDPRAGRHASALD